MVSLILFFLTTTPRAVTAPDAVLSEQRQWEIIEACPKLMLTTSGQTKVSVGSAVCIANIGNTAYLLTADHVVNRSGSIKLEFYTKESYTKGPFATAARELDGVYVVHQFREPDFALLSVATGSKPLPHLPLAGDGKRPKKFPFEALSVGHENGLMSCRAEKVIGKKLGRGLTVQDIAFNWQLAKPTIEGRSGGPLIDSGGNVIGICVAYKDGRGYATHLDEILAGLKREKKYLHVVENSTSR